MLLASVPRDVLDEVCVARSGSMWDTLAPVRAMRPVNGGAGFDRHELERLRGLHFMLA
uniref:Uncharacterized protein n=1 Tax=Tetraselmis sp. GSL018 TaxID=582737 RepID=A0A061RTP9_9CHLO